VRPTDPDSVRILTEAHVESLRGGRRRAATRRLPRTNWP